MFEFRDPVHMRFPKEAEVILGQIRMVLARLYVESIRAVAGGGVLRDLYLERPYKDIDLFVNAADASDEKVHAVLAELGFQSRLVVSNEATEYLSFTDVSSVIEATHPAVACPLQIIRVSHNNLSGERMIERLDLGPCQVGMDYLGRFWHTEQFWKDVCDRTFTITRSENRDVVRSTKRFDRLVQKYPGWKLVTPVVMLTALEADITIIEEVA